MQFVGGSLLVHSFADNLYCASTLKSLRCDSTLKKYISQSGGRCLRDRWLKTGKKTHPHSYLFVEFGWTGPLRKHIFKNMTEMCHIFFMRWRLCFPTESIFIRTFFFFFLSVILFCFRKKSSGDQDSYVTKHFCQPIRADFQEKCLSTSTRCWITSITRYLQMQRTRVLVWEAFWFLFVVLCNRMKVNTSYKDWICFNAVWKPDHLMTV